MFKSMPFKRLEAVLKQLDDEGKLIDFEGHVAQAPYVVGFLVETIARLPKNSKILQIGFNAGHSTVLMLNARNDVTITSVDIGKNYIHECNESVNKSFPGRHTLIIGDSLEVIPKLKEEFDLFFIDGGHQYDVVRGDLENCYNLGRSGSYILMDDVAHLIDCTNDHTYLVGPTKAYTEFVKMGKVINIANIEVGNRGMALCIISKPQPQPQPQAKN